jgi:large conductance mechanosensitive channel
VGALDDFKAFIAQGNIVSLAVAFVIAAAFTLVVASFVTNIIMPIVGIPGHVDFSQQNVTVQGSVISYGLFINAVISFVIVAAVIFFGIVRPLAKREERKKARKAAEPPTTKDCPFCLSKIPIKATKCLYCTSSVP